LFSVCPQTFRTRSSSTNSKTSLRFAASANPCGELIRRYWPLHFAVPYAATHSPTAWSDNKARLLAHVFERFNNSTIVRRKFRAGEIYRRKLAHRYIFIRAGGKTGDGILSRKLLLVWSSRQPWATRGRHVGRVLYAVCGLLILYGLGKPGG